MAFGWGKIRFTCVIAAASGAALASLLAHSGTASAQSGNRPATAIVLDNSASMWGQINGKNKVVLVREALTSALPKTYGKIDLSLLSFGHKSKKSCTDVTTLVPLSPSGDIHTATAKGVRPRGATPLSLAISNAAKTLPGARRGKHVVVIADGTDNCKADPCAMARTLKKNDPALALHLIAINPKISDSLRKASCIAKLTGGLYVETNNGEELNGALNAVMTRIMKGPRKALPKAKPLSTAQIIPRGITVPGVQLAPVPGSGTGSGSGTPAPKQPAPSAPSDTVAAPSVGTPDPGAPNLGATTQLPSTANAADTAAAGQGTLALRALLSENGGAIPRGLVWRVYKPLRTGAPELVKTVRGGDLTLSLAPGSYLVNAAYGRASQTQKVDVQASVRQELPFILNAGGLTVAVSTSDTSEDAVDPVRFSVFTDERDQFGKRRMVIENVRPGLIIRLNAGLYHLVSAHGDANAVVRSDVLVEAGKLTKALVRHDSAKVTFKLVLRPGGEALANTRWRMFTADGELVKESFGALPSHFLAPGTYRVEALRNGLKFRRQFTLQGGQRGQVEVVASAQQFTAPTPKDVSIPGVELRYDPTQQ